MGKKPNAAALGTALFMRLGCGAAVIGGAEIGFTGIALAST
jgi:hypothetical protein